MLFTDASMTAENILSPTNKANGHTATCRISLRFPERLIFAAELLVKRLPGRLVTEVAIPLS